MTEHELPVVIVGGGPAGLAVGLALRHEGLPATVVERRTPPLDKACGEGLMPDAVGVLEALGVDLAAAGGHPFGGIRWIDGETVAEGRFPGAPGLGLRRPRLHRGLASRAEALGVELLWGVRVRGLVDGGEGGVETDRGVLPARRVIGADGLHSDVRRWAGLEGPPARRRRFGMRRHFAAAPWTDRVEVHWVEGAEAYVTPVAGDEVGVALLWSGERLGFDALLARFPRLVDRLAGAPAVGDARGAGPLEQRATAVARGRVALIGDAAGYVDAITGEGMAVALHQALALAESIRVGHLASYPRLHAGIVRLPELMTRLLLAAEARPPMRRRLIRLLAADPGLFDRLLAVHAREAGLGAVGLGGMTRLAGAALGLLAATAHGGPRPDQ